MAAADRLREARDHVESAYRIIDGVVGALDPDLHDAGLQLKGGLEHTLRRVRNLYLFQGAPGGVDRRGASRSTSASTPSLFDPER